MHELRAEAAGGARDEPDELALGGIGRGHGGADEGVQGVEGEGWEGRLMSALLGLRSGALWRVQRDGASKTRWNPGISRNVRLDRGKAALDGPTYIPSSRPTQSACIFHPCLPHIISPFPSHITSEDRGPRMRPHQSSNADSRSLTPDPLAHKTWQSKDDDLRFQLRGFLSAFGAKSHTFPSPPLASPRLTSPEPQLIHPSIHSTRIPILTPPETSTARAVLRCRPRYPWRGDERARAPYRRQGSTRAGLGV